MEIERKFRIKKLPDLSGFEKKEIEQGYLCQNPIVRIRKSNEQYILTYKNKLQNKGEAIVNEEIELPLSKEAYEHLREKTDYRLITKTRYLIPIENGLTVELDVFSGHLSGLFFAEVEFKDEEAARNFIPPEWLGEDVSGDKRFGNYYLSKVDSIDELDAQ